MKIKVNEQPQRFYLAMNKWVPAVGHGMQVGDIQLCAIPMGKVINISEVSSGTKLTTYKLDIVDWFETEEKEGFLNLLQRIGESLVTGLSKIDHIDAEIKKMRKVAIDKLGPMPVIEDVDVEELLECA